jgi:hypothetical protein
MAMGKDLESQLIQLKNENEELFDQFEQTITRANSLEVQAEIARLEFNQVFNAIDDAICLTEKCPLNTPRKKIDRFELDIEIENTNGEKVPFWLTITPLLGLVQETIGIVEQFKDITERKHY